MRQVVVLLDPDVLLTSERLNGRRAGRVPPLSGVGLMAGLGPEQIQALFAQEASVRLDHLDQLLLQLEQTGDDETLIRSVFRELHTLKGSSAVAGLAEVSRRAHELEDLVEDLRAGGGWSLPN